MSGQELENLIRERNKLRIELARERIINQYRHKAFVEMWAADGKKPATFREYFCHHTDFETYMRSVPDFSIDPEPGADNSRLWQDYLIFLKSWEENGPDFTFSAYLEHLNQRYDMMDQD